MCSETLITGSTHVPKFYSLLSDTYFIPVSVFCGLCPNIAPTLCVSKVNTLHGSTENWKGPVASFLGLVGEPGNEAIKGVHIFLRPTAL